MFDPQYWFLFPTGIAIAILAMSAGISGSNFWIPVFLIGLGFEPVTAFWLSLFTMIFSFGSGAVKNIHGGTVDWGLFRVYLVLCLPAGIVGGLLSPYAPQQWLIAVFSFFVLGFGLWQLVHAWKPDPDGVHLKKPAWRIAIMAGFLQGLIATGLGKLIMPVCLRHERLKHHADAVGTTVLLVFTVSLGAVVSRLNLSFLARLQDQSHDILAVMSWVAPGVVIGGQVGPAIARRMPRRWVRPYAGLLLILVSGLMFTRVFG